MAQRFWTPNEQFCDGTGAPYAGGNLFFYASGTATPQNTYSDSGLQVANPNPITLDSAGRAGSIFLGANAYKVVLQDAGGNQIWTEDPVSNPPAAPVYVGGTTTGSANSQVLAATSPSGYVRAAGNIIIAKAGFTNLAAMTLNVAATGAVNVMVVNSTGPVALSGGEVIANTEFIVMDDGTQYVLLNPSNAVLGLSTVWTTGDVKTTIKTVADAGWVMMNDGTIGDASSGGTTRANADTSALFTLLWNNCADAQCPVSSGRGASAAADFAAHKTITLPLMLGRALASSGAGAGLTSRVLGLTTGGETQTLVAANLPPHSHTVAISNSGAGGSNTGGVMFASGSINTGNGPGTSTAFSIMQPSIFLNFMIKL